MARSIIPVGLSARELRAELAQLGKILAGKARDRTGMGKLWKSYFTRRLLDHLYRAYREKAKGTTDALGRYWEPLSPRTLAKKGPRKGILRVTDRLYKSLRPGEVVGGTYAPSGEDQVVRFKSGTIEIDIKVPYFDYHQEGTMRIPQRLIIPSPEKMQPWIEDATAHATRMMVRWLKERGRW